MIKTPRYKAVLFDIDDTLLKTREPKWQQHKWVAKHYYNIELTDEVLRQNWGRPFDELTEVLYQGNGTPGERRANFLKHELEFPKDYEPFALDTIHRLHAAGLTMGLMTAMFKKGAKIDFKNLNFPVRYFATFQGSEATKYHKPDSRVFNPTLENLRLAGISDGIAYVGEAVSDYEAATKAGLDFLAITQGFANETDFGAAGVEHIFGNLRAVGDFILQT